MRQRAAPATAPAAPLPAGELVPFVDAHVHLNDEAMQRDLMGRFGAQRAIVFWGRAGDNESIAEAARRHPDLFIPFASVSPERRAYRGAWEADPQPLLDRLDALLASGTFKGIGEISAVHFPSPGLAEADFDPSGAMMRGILRLARKYRVPVLVHVESTRQRELSELLGAFPDVTVIWAHGGYTPLVLAQRMLERHPNMIYELSARTWAVHPRSPDYTILRDGERVWPQWLEFIEAQAHQIIIGTDASHRSRASEEMKAAAVQNLLRQLRPGPREQVARGTVLKLLGLPLP